MAAKIVRALIGIWIIFLIGYFGFKFYQKHKAQNRRCASPGLPENLVRQKVFLFLSLCQA